MALNIKINVSHVIHINIHKRKNLKSLYGLGIHLSLPSAPEYFRKDR
jgi:hypothetical protein